MNERIKEVRNRLGFTQTEMAQRLGIANNTITAYEAGRRIPSTAIITSICREFNVNEEWLLNGTGEMFNELSNEEMAARLVGRLFATKDPFIVNTLKAIGSLTPDQWAILKEIAEQLKKEE